MELQFGIYNGEVADNKPHGKGSVTFYPDDLGGRKVFDGTWVNGRRDGPGKMTWTTGEVSKKFLKANCSPWPLFTLRFMKEAGRIISNRVRENTALPVATMTWPCGTR